MIKDIHNHLNYLNKIKNSMKEALKKLTSEIFVNKIINYQKNIIYRTSLKNRSE